MYLMLDPRIQTQRCFPFPRTIKNLLSKLDPLLVESFKPIKSPVQCLIGQLTLNPVEPRLLC